MSERDLRVIILIFNRGVIMTTASVSVSANIPNPLELGVILDKFSRAEERSKRLNYIKEEERSKRLKYIKELENYIKELEKQWADWADRIQSLTDRVEDLEDYYEAKQAHDEFLASGEKAVPFEDMRIELNL